MTLFKNKYRIESARLQTWDYASEGSYFITICTKDRKHYFGEIVNGKMHLSGAGILADVFWHEIKNHVRNIELGEFVVMPNHIHGILILHNIDEPVEARHAFPLSPIAPPSIAPPSIAPQPNSSPKKNIGQTRFQNPGKNSISSIIGGYKSAVTKHCNRLGFENGWQSLFHDHIIRDERAFENIHSYISKNFKNLKVYNFFFKIR